MNMRNAWIVFIATLLTGCSSVMLATLKPPKVSLEDVRPIELGLLQQRFELELRMDNPNDLDLNLEALEFDLDLNGQPLASGLSTQPVIIPGLGNQVVKLEAVTTSSKLIKQLRGLNLDALGNGANYQIKGRAKVQGLDWLPFEKSGQVGKKKDEKKPSGGQTI
jgi:LEA14-like dessication related protein